MLKPISAYEAFNLLMNEATAKRVFFKNKYNTDYLRAKNHRWAFWDASKAENFKKVTFYVKETNK